MSDLAPLLTVMAETLDDIDNAEVLYRQAQATKRDYLEMAKDRALGLSPADVEILKMKANVEQEAAADYLHIKEQLARRFRYLDLKGSAAVANARLPDVELNESIEEKRDRLKKARAGGDK